MNLDIKLLSTSMCNFFTNAAHCISSVVLVVFVSSGVVADGVFEEPYTRKMIPLKIKSEKEHILELNIKNLNLTSAF